MKPLSDRPTVQPIIVVGYGFISGAMVMCGILIADAHPWLGGSILFGGSILLGYALSLKVSQ